MLIPKKTNSYFWLLLVSFSCAYFLIKYASPVFLGFLYASKNFSLLSFLSGLDASHSLTEYLGLIQDRWIGPLLQIIASGVLTAFSLKYFTHAGKTRFACLIFLFLMITKFEVLFFPCYGEAGAAPIAEGIWLQQHGFNYIELFHQKNFNFGGPKAYMFSSFPTYVALLLSVFRAPKVFLFAYHLSMFVFAAGIVSLFRSFLKKNYDEKISLLAAILLVSLPLFQSLVELMNMEIFCLFFAMLSMYFLGQKKILGASAMAVLASLAKGPGGIACGVVFFVSCILFFFDDEERFQFRNIIYGAVSVVIAAFKLYLLKTYVNPIQTNDRAIRFFVGWRPLQGSKVILFVYGLTVLCVVFVFVREFLAKEKNAKAFFLRHYIAGIAFSMVTAWLGLYLNLSVMGPRYKLIIAPFMIVCGLFSIHAFVKSRKILQGVLIVAIVIAGLGSYGLFYPKKIASSTYSFNNLERTLEYRNDLYMNRLLAKTIQTEFPGLTVGAPFVIAQHYAMPLLGYVDAPREVVMYGMSVDYANIKPFTGLQSMDLPHTIWIGFSNQQNSHGIDFPMNLRYDRLVKKIAYGDKEIFLFQGGAGIQQMAELLYRIQMQKLSR